MARERVQKIMSHAGIDSRRACEKIIDAGRVTVNGERITLGDKADPETDDIRVDGKPIHADQIEYVYYVVHKPQGVLSAPATAPGDERPTVIEGLPFEDHLFTIGRLDADSEGMMIITNDGDLANRLAHPRYEHTKTYKVVVYDEMSEEKIEEWRNGLFLGPGEKTAPCSVKVLDSNRKTTTLEVVMIEGKKRQIRRVGAMLGHPVKSLIRTHIGQLGLGTLSRGEWYRLGDEEVAYLSQPAPELEEIRQRQKDLRQKARDKRRSRK
jgi:pseudouridine synthase